MKENTVCFTGPRPEKLPWGECESDERYGFTKTALRIDVENAISSGKTHFISGMARGIDLVAAEIVLQFKKENPNITLECAIPCKYQCKNYPFEDLKRYQKILAQADKCRCIQDHYIKSCMQERDRYKVNNSSLVIAVYGGTGGGTLQTIEYAKKQGVKVEIVKPYEFADIEFLGCLIDLPHENVPSPQLTKKKLKAMLDKVYDKPKQKSAFAKRQEQLEELPDSEFSYPKILQMIDELQNRKKKKK